MLTHSKSLSTLPASSAHICLYVAFILQTASTTAPLNCFPEGNTCAHEQAGRISPKDPALTIYGSLDHSTGEQPRIHQTKRRKTPTMLSKSVEAVTPGHPNQSLCPVCVGVQRREINLFAGRAVKQERRKGSSRRQQPAYGAAVNEVARELQRSARSPKRENGGQRYIKHDGMIASPVGSCLCC